MNKILGRLWRNSDASKIRSSIGTHKKRLFSPEIIQLSEQHDDKFKRGILKLSVGARHCLALLNDHRVMAYGNNDYGQCGPFNQTIMTSWDSDDEVLVPAVVPGLKDSIVDIACGDYHNVALTGEGKVLTWGSAILGHGDEVYQVQPRVVEQLDLFGQAVSVHAAAGYSLVRYPDCLVAFGYLPSSKGIVKVLEPLKLDYFDGCDDIKQVSTSVSHFCVLHGDRMLFIFGSKDNIDCKNEYAPVYKDDDAVASLKYMKPLREFKLGYNAKLLASCDNGIYILNENNQIIHIDITNEDAVHKHFTMIPESSGKICMLPVRDALYIISRSNGHSITKVTGSVIEKEEDVSIDADAFGSCRDRIVGLKRAQIAVFQN